jgi:hypothetical protein
VGFFSDIVNDSIDHRRRANPSDHQSVAASAALSPIEPQQPIESFVPFPTHANKMDVHDEPVNIHSAPPKQVRSNKHAKSQTQAEQHNSAVEPLQAQNKPASKSASLLHNSQGINDALANQKLKPLTNKNINKAIKQVNDNKRDSYLEIMADNKLKGSEDSLTIGKDAVRFASENVKNHYSGEAVSHTAKQAPVNTHQPTQNTQAIDKGANKNDYIAPARAKHAPQGEQQTQLTNQSEIDPKPQEKTHPLPQNEPISAEYLAQKAMASASLAPSFEANLSKDVQLREGARQFAEHNVARINPPVVKIGQVNVIVEGPAVTQKPVSRSAIDNSSRTFLRSL